MSERTLYERLGGYDGITAFVENLLPRLQADRLLKRYWENRGDDGVAREKQLLIDFLCSSAGGPVYYSGRDMKLSHKGMKISEEDWAAFFGHAGATMEDLAVPKQECGEIVTFVTSLKGDIVEA